MLGLRRHLVGDKLNFWLYMAIEEKDITAVRELVRKGANVNAREPEGIFPVTTGSPLHCAVYVGDAKIVEELIKFDATVDAKDEDGQTPLHWAARYGKIEIINALLNTDVEINCKDKWGRTPLAWAILHHYRHFSEIAAPLIDKGAEQDVLTAARLGDLKKVQQLIEGGADITVKDGWTEETPLHIAAREGHTETVGLLLDQGAEINARTAYGTECKGYFTPLHLAVGERHQTTVEALLERGADVNAKTNDGWTALRLAIERKDVEIAQLLRQHGGIA